MLRIRVTSTVIQRLNPILKACFTSMVVFTSEAHIWTFPALIKHIKVELAFSNVTSFGVNTIFKSIA